MKFDQIRTLENLLKEYGMQSGVSTTVGAQQTGAVAKSTAAQKPVSSPTTNKPSPSPTTNTVPGEVSDQEKPVVTKARELKTDFEFPSKEGNVVKVISAYGQGKNKKSVVVQDQKTKEYYSMDPEDKIALPQLATEAIKTKDITLNKLTKRKNKLHRKIKKLLRAQKHAQQGSPIFEINFNNKDVAKSALNAPIKCGFEAETTWPGIQGGADEDDTDWLDDLNWNRVSDLIYDQEGGRSVDTVEEAYREWLQESDYFYEAENDVINDLVNDRKEDEAYLDDYVSERVDDTDIENYKDNYLDGMSDEERAEFEDWDDAAWARQYVEEEQQDNFEEWLADQIRDNGEQWDDAWDRALEAADMDDWVRVEHSGSWYSLLSDFDIYLHNEDAGGGLDDVASRIEDWASNNSQSNDVRAGDYHSGSGVDNTYWRVEADSSIEGDGTGAEIISPVYDSPAKMLEEMKSLFEFLKSEGAETNDSTGLHVTMSWAGSENQPANKLKIAMLLGDKYVLKQFNREFNTYTTSQQKRLQDYVSSIRDNVKDERSLKSLEDMISGGLSAGKFSSINFKDAENEAGNNLIEFRVAGGEDYHTMTEQVMKAVIRYAAVMQAGHDPDAYRKDYIRSLFRMISGTSKLSSDTQQKAQQMVDPASINDRVLGAFQAMASEKHYTDAIEALGTAYKQLADVQAMRKADPQKELQFEDEQDADWRREMIKAQKYFVRAFAMLTSDVASGANRAPAKAVQVAALRTALSEFGFTTDQLWGQIQQSEFYARFPGDVHNKSEKFAAAFNSMLKKQTAKGLEADFTVKYNPAKQRMFMPDTIANSVAAASGSIFFGGARDQAKLPEKFTPEMFKAVDNSEYEAARDARYNYDVLVARVSHEQEIINSFKDKLKLLKAAPPAMEAEAADLEQAVNARTTALEKMQAEQQVFKQIMDRFQKKHGFLPPSRRSNSETIGGWELVNQDTLSWISAKYNIKFTANENKMTAFDRFDKLPLAEQLNILSKVDKKKLDEAWSNKQKATIINEEWYDAYRDFKGMGYSDTQARAEANRMFPQPQQSPTRPAQSSQKPELRYYMFYNVPAGREQDALNMGVKKLKSGKFAIPVYNTSGRQTQTKINNADAEFGTATKWAPKKTNETIEAEQDMAASLTAYGTPKKKKKSAKVREGDVVAFPGTHVKKEYVTINNVTMLKDVWEYMSQEREIETGKRNFTGKEDPKLLKKAYQAELMNFIDEFEMNDMDPQAFVDELNQISESYGRYYCSTDKKWKERKGPKQKRKVKEGAVPDNDRMRKLKTIMNKPLLASDLRGQMEAYFVIPDPSMIKEFRQASAMSSTTDLRSIVKSYMHKLHPTDQKALTESRVQEAAATTLNPAKLTKDPGRMQNLLNNIRGRSPLYLTDGTPVTIAQPEADRLEDLWKNNAFQGRIVIQGEDGKQYPLSGFLKTSDYGGQAVPPGQEATTEISKEAAALKPSDIGLEDKKIPAAQVAATIQGNAVLKQTAHGEAVIEMSKQISRGENPVIPAKQFSKGVVAAINDYAGEYLGVQALIEGTSHFPMKNEFIQWMGKDVKDLIIEFPSATNEPLADSYGLIDPKTGKQLKISSKGKGGGAPPSITSLDPTPEMRKDKNFQSAVKFIDIIKNEDKSLPMPSTISQPFAVMNMLYDTNSALVPQKFHKYLPWSNDDIKKIIVAIKSGEPLPKNMQNLWSEFKFSDRATDGGKLGYAVKHNTMEAINNGGLPGFQAAVIEILGLNFVQQNAIIRRGVMGFDTQWPAKLNAGVTVESKSGATDLTKGSYSFKLHF